MFMNPINMGEFSLTLTPYESNVITVYAKIIQIREGQYTYIIVEDLNRELTDDYKYLTLVKLPNWDDIHIDIGDVGYVQFESVFGGKSQYLDRDTGEIETYKYSNNYIMSFIKKDIELCNKQFRF